MSGKTKSKTIEETYVKKNLKQQIKDCPDMCFWILEQFSFTNIYTTN